MSSRRSQDEVQKIETGHATGVLHASSTIDQLSVSVGGHARVIEGIERSDSEVAERAIQTNWQNGADKLC